MHLGLLVPYSFAVDGSSVLVETSSIPGWTVDIGHIPQGTHLGLTWAIGMTHLTLPKSRLGLDSTENIKVFPFLKNMYMYININIYTYIVQFSNFAYRQSG